MRAPAHRRKPGRSALSNLHVTNPNPNLPPALCSGISYYIFPENTLVYVKFYIDLLARVKERLVVDKKLYKEVERY